MTAQITEADQALKFMLAGKATVTIKSLESGEHLTYRINKPKPDKAKPNGPTHFVKVRTGNDFAYLGFIADVPYGSGGGQYVHGRNADLPITSKEARAFRWAFGMLSAGRFPRKLEVWHEGTCGRCGRALTHPESIASGIGPECKSKMECA